MMIYVGLFFVSMFIGLLAWYWFDYRVLKKEPYRRHQLRSGLISFSDRETFLLYVFWPITWFAVLLFVLICWGSTLVAHFNKKGD